LEEHYSGAQHEHHTPVPHRHKPRPLRKVLTVLLLSALLFGGGYIAGQGGLHMQKAIASSRGSLDYSSVDEVYGLLKKDFDGNLSATKLTDGLRAGLVSAAGDPYTKYFNPSEAKDFNNELSGTITGIGAELGTSGNDIVIVSPLADSPADKAGLKPKDVVAGIDGKSTTGLSVDTVVGKIRGPEGTQVKLTIVRNGGNPITVTITRAKITVPSVKWHEDGAIGYMKISQFTEDTDKLSQQAANEFKSKGVKAIVLDLRGNPGGYLTGAVNVSSLWLDQGKVVVQERRGSTVIDTQTATGNNILKGIPTIVLIDGGSASASEITAGALKDNGAATLLGQKSFGKGSVQQVEHLLDGSEVKITIAHWYTPNGKNIDKQGITPDTVVTVSDDDAKAGTDTQKDKAYQLLQAKF
jgi:carboxyl-terminal processing protease